jgi:HSP20 family protein
MREFDMSEEIENAMSPSGTGTDAISGVNWFDSLRWMPREFRDWVANDTIRLEEFTDDHGMTIRAEIPGVDPSSDVDVCVVDGHLSIEARRRAVIEHDHEGRRRSEFRYGDFYRRLTLPAGAKDDEISASYDKGILTIDVPIEQTAKVPVRVVPVN